MTLQQYWQYLTRQLAEVSATPTQEAQLILCHVLDCQLSYLYTYPEQSVTDAQQQAVAAIAQRRCQGEPLAYIFGYWHFFGLTLAVSPSTLIPRADTEVLVEQALALALPADAKVLDLGTGTGAIALALQQAMPGWHVTAVEQHATAVALAQQNARQLQLPVQIIQSNWFSALSDCHFDLIVSNPPYIESADPHLAALSYEPLTALVAGDDGLTDLRQIVSRAPDFLTHGGWLWLEHGYDQADAVAALLASAGFCEISSKRDYGGNWRISGGQYFHAAN